MTGDGPAPLFRYRFGTAEFDESRFELRIGDAPVEVQRKPLEVLALLLRHVDEVVTREELLEQVWEGRPTVEHVVANALAKLRAALGSGNAARIVTQMKVGYRLTGPVERVVMGRHFTSSLRLAAGQPAPGREGFQLETLLGGPSNSSEVWLARHRKTGEARVYKFCADGARLAVLKREATLYRVLRESLGERRDIACIIDWNFESTPFFLECEYAGQNLLAWAQDHLADLSLQARIEIFLQIADAVGAAHSVGVLHKDLKPANILISADPSGWKTCVTDFGSGRLTEPQRLAALGITRMGLTLTQNIGSDASSATLLYLAPDVIAGHAATVRTDVYALGLILYQLVAGDLRKPLVSGWERDVPDALLRDDIRKATDGDPEQRLEGVGQLTERLRGAGQRREAMLRAQAVQRARQRRPWVIALMVTLSAGLLTSVWSLYKEQVARGQADAEKARVEAVNAYLAEVLRGWDSANWADKTSVPFREVLDRTTARMGDRFSGDPLTEARIQLALAEVWSGLGEYARVNHRLMGAVELLTEAGGATAIETIQAQYALSRSLSLTTRFDKATQVLDAADKAAGQRLASDPSLALHAHWARATLLQAQMKPVEARREFEAAERARTQLELPGMQWQLRLRTGVAWHYTATGRPVDAVHSLQDFVTTEFAVEDMGINDWSAAHLQYATALAMLGRDEEAIRVATTALAEMERQLGPGHYLVGLGWSRLAACFDARGEWENAAVAARHAYETLLSTVGIYNQSTLLALGSIAVVEYRRGNIRGSVAGLKAAREKLAQRVGETNPLTQYIDMYLASALMDLGRVDEARQLAGRLDADALAAASPIEEDWRVRIQALEQGAPRMRGAARDDAQTPPRSPAPTASTISLAGHWNSNTGIGYDIAQSGGSFSWKVMHGTSGSHGEGRLVDRYAEVHWPGPEAAGSAVCIIFEAVGQEAIGISCSNGVRLTRARSVKSPLGFNLSGHWYSNIGFEYDFVQSGDSYTWTVARGTVHETGILKVDGQQYFAQWSGTNGAGGGSGDVVQLPDGQIELQGNNGVTFRKQQ